MLILLACVAIFAAAANVFVESGATIARLVTPDVDVAPAAAASVSRRADPPGPPVRDTVRLSTALGEFDQALRLAIEGSSAELPRTYQIAVMSLNRAATAFAEGGNPGAAEAAGIRDASLARAAEATRVIDAARRARAAVANYATVASTMSARLQKSIDGAWKILGRVVARQSLMKLSAQLDDIQSTFARRDTLASLNELSSSLVQPEQTFATTLQKNSDALRRSQGNEWVDAMRADVVALDSARNRMARAETERRRLAQEFFAETDRLTRTLVAIAARPLPAARTAARAVAATDVSGATPAPEVTANTPDARRSMIASLSLGLLALLTYICIVTILGVIRQVRSLMAATRRLANGEPIKPIRPGGIRELDELGVAIDSMARQLAAAQMTNLEAQRRLEGTVAERTRDLKNLAEKDPLTDLPNRRQLFTELGESIELARESRRRLGVFYLDVDNFKTLNDSLGHTFGDRVLIAIARRLAAVAKPFGFAGRLGGDEFMIVQEEAASSDEIRASGHAIVRAFEAPIEIDGREIIVGVSVGASVYPDHEKDAEALLRAADAALFSAKELGRSRLAMFTPELLVRVSAKFAIEQRLRRALEKREFELFYQPEVNVRTFEVTLVEALIRWRMPDGSHQCPAEFLSVAEEFGLIAEIDDWVLETAVEDAARWYRGNWAAARVAVNVSPRQLLDQRFVGKLRELLARTGLPPNRIELELTESVLQTGAATIRALTELRALGVAIALDDFGSGYSSMSSLEQLPLTRVKLDRSLIARMDSSARSASIARATLGLCTELGLEVTAEGVERVEQFSALLGFGAISLQGYLLSMPIPREQLLPALFSVPARCEELVLSCRAQGGSVRMRPGAELADLDAMPA